MKYIDDESKKIAWYNENVFYLCTLAVIICNVGAFFIGGRSWAPEFSNAEWTDILNFDNLFAVVLSAFEHSNLQHCLLNSLCFLVAGVYLERKIGTVNLSILVFSLVFFGECAVKANHQGGSHGFSGVNYGLYAYILVDYLCMFIEKKQTKINMIYGAIVVALIYLAACFSGGTAGFSFQWYPYDLITNMGHYTSFLTGAILSLLLKFIKWQTVKETK